MQQMKKIVALVLTLVLALSLATVAFAADDSYFADKVGGFKIASTDNMTLTLEQVRDAGAQNVAVYGVFCNVGTNKYPMAGSYVLADSSSYDYVFCKGTTITYLKKSVTGAYNGEATVITPVKAADAKCGDIVAADGVTLYKYNGQIMKATETFTWEKAVKNAVDDVIKEGVESLTFTKADWEKGIKDYLYDVLVEKTATLDFTSPENFIANVIWGVYNEARENYNRGEFPAFWTLVKNSGETVFGLVKGIWNTLTWEFPNATTNILTWPMDAINELSEKVEAALAAYFGESEGTSYSEASLNTDAQYNGKYLGLNLVRELLEPAHTIKAIALVDGKLVTLANAEQGALTKTYDSKTGALTATVSKDYAIVAHSYAVDYAAVGGTTQITKVYCDTCGTAFDFVVGDETDATLKFGVGNYKKITEEFKTAFTTKFLGKHVVGWNWDTMSFKASWDEGTGYTWNMFDTASRSIKEALDGDDLWISAAAAAAGPADTNSNTGVKAPETFDAGIALYAGMALMSVAGSAVVIGKKKEF